MSHFEYNKFNALGNDYCYNKGTTTKKYWKETQQAEKGLPLARK